jgi:hypothetical protein
MIGARQTWGRRPAIRRATFPHGETVLQSARRFFRLGKSPCKLRDDFSAGRNPQFLRFDAKNHLKTLNF